MNEDGMMMLIEAIYKQLEDDYRLLWYIKTHYEGSEKWLIRSEIYKGKKKIGHYIHMNGINSTIGKELKDMEEYLTDIVQKYAHGIINYLRETAESERMMRCAKERIIVA